MLPDETEENIQVYKEVRNIANTIGRCQKRLDIKTIKWSPECFSSNVSRSKMDANRKTVSCPTMMGI